MGQELVTQAHPLAGPLQQPGHVGQGEHVALARPVDHAQHGLHGGERVVGHLGLGVRQPPQQRRLAGVGQSGQAGVGHELAATGAARGSRPLPPARRTWEPGGRS